MLISNNYVLDHCCLFALPTKLAVASIRTSLTASVCSSPHFSTLFAHTLVCSIVDEDELSFDNNTSTISYTFHHVRSLSVYRTLL